MTKLAKLLKKETWELPWRREIRLRDKRIAEADALIARLVAAVAERTEGVVKPGHPLADAVAVEVDRGPKEQGTVFAFGGLAGHMHIPAAEFRKALSARSYAVVFAKDLFQVWYQKGLPGLANSREAVAPALKRRFGHLPRPWYAIGASAGGFAAIVFGTGLGVARVLALSPRTVVKRETANIYRQTALLDPSLDPMAPLSDCRDALAESGYKNPLWIIYGVRNPFDRLQAKRLKDHPGVEMMPVNTPGHSVGAVLKRASLLDPVLDAFFCGDTSAARTHIERMNDPCPATT